ncbi:CobW family GTP-binding protein [Mycobacterium montefiorense]|uniref:Cobalamin biosynthesis protein CobW n=1 Tax=Mycobacterium montefiorense TaxID=154654 RepID=A0AA37UP73_9MYCO|nr:GTP-binding protein [Mycobacterium montefiorense]GBG39159.1 cobalamin biosynthesis protein CobW [Mycobacterium montefiorense]GKU37368.1 cobalamin biosynthesis protein CobW [Mycobacterium montefiorense]GKU42016.1 cobalamin biosynthesis protein CobW [Mycobacterium montefiorense]GKU45522.1 cobalamin biosynthesis protein CobW [Mycobacterium montefiorense]GKU53516.1 cobalamin biosynthesis protein CobW [Mycobacterium montefiorense]
MRAIPVISLTGYLGAGKTTLLNHVLRSPGARIGVIINDFGELNVDAMLVTGQVDEPASIAGGCICCLPDDGGIDDALAKLADPRLDLDAVIVEASGLAEPVAVARIIGFSEVPGIRFGGLVDVVDATTHFDTVDVGAMSPARYGVASLVVVNKLDQLPQHDRTAMVERVERQVRERNPRATVVGSVAGQIDPALLYDVAGTRDEPGQLSLRELLVDTSTDPPIHNHDHDNSHADAVTATSTGEIDPGALIDLLENPPPGAYRLKGAVAVRYGAATHTYAVNLVGAAIHIAIAPPGMPANCLVAIGIGLDTHAVRARLDAALRPFTGSATLANIHRLRRYRRRNL